MATRMPRGASLGRAGRGGRGAGLFIGLAAAGLGVALLASGKREPEGEAFERVGDDELPDADDLAREMSHLGLTPTGEPLQLDEAPVRLEAIDTPGHEVPISVPVAKVS